MFSILLKSLKMKMSLACFLAIFALQMGWSQQYTVSGKITTEDGSPLAGIQVNTGVQGLPIVYTNSAGTYEFQLDAGEDATIAPYNNNEALFGVSTYDKVLVTRHIDGVQLLDSPYKIIAGDVDHNGVLNYADTTAMSEVILGITLDFPNNTSWRFVDAGFTFPNPANPFLTALPEIISINSISADVTGLDFIGIKVGDVNHSATINPFLGAKVKGKVYFDEDESCTQTAGETPLKNWKVKATNPTLGTFYANTYGNGNYDLYVIPGTYEVEIVPANALWEACTPVVSNVTLAFQGTYNVDFAMKAVNECPAMEVELSTWLLRRCSTSYYTVNYCNQGTSTAVGANVVVTLDPYFDNVSSSIPWASVTGNTYNFNLGDVAPGECASFQIFFDVSCDAELGQTHCSSAHIYPELSCLPVDPLWSGANLIVTGVCAGDEVNFTITNYGAAMTQAADYVIIEDVMIQMSGSLQLGQGESMFLPPVPANGATWRAQADESPFHPYATFASATVEGCTNGNPVTFGFVNQFPMPDEAPFEDIDCMENVSSYDPNDKVGLPLGVEAEHFIEQNQDLSYTIRFQNTGTDTAFNIFIIDSLSTSLDPATMRILGSSHPCDLLLEGHGVAKFIFSNIMLPDSNINETLSHGFVKFAIKQRTDVAIGTKIENEAGIYFDFNEPVITNRTLHTVGKDFLMEVSATQTLLKGVEMEVFPNPTAAIANFRFKGLELNDGLLTVFDQQGRQVGALNFTGSSCQFDGTGLASGLYFFKVNNAGSGVATGKILVK